MRSEPGAIDTRELVSVCGSGPTPGDALLREILGYFVRQNRERMEQAAEAVAAGDRERLGQIGHAVKGSAAMIGAGRLQLLAGRIERDAAAATPDVLNGWLGDMRQEFEAVLLSLGAEHPDAFDATGDGASSVT